MLTFIVCILIIRATFGLDWMINLYGNTLHRLINFAEKHDVNLNEKHVEKANDAELMGSELIRTSYYIMYATSIIKVMILPKEHAWSRFGISTALLMRLAPAVIVFLNIPYSQNIKDVICDGFFMAILTSDITLAKMASREVSESDAVWSMASIEGTLQPTALQL